MIVCITSDAEADIAQGYWFYEEQSHGLGDYFRDCILADIDSLMFYGGIHGNGVWIPSYAREDVSFLHLLSKTPRRGDRSCGIGRET